MASKQNGFRDELFIQGNSKPRDLIVYTDGSVTSEYSADSSGGNSRTYHPLDCFKR